VAERLTVIAAARLSRYLQVLAQARKEGRVSITSQEISEYTNIHSTQVRRDLSGLGQFGKRGAGYVIEPLVAELRAILRNRGQYNIALFGAGRLGQAIASSPIFAAHGFHIEAVFDVDPTKLGQPIGHTLISDYSQMQTTLTDRNIIVAVLAVPASAAQTVTDDLVAAGIKVIFNYTEALLTTPPEVSVQTMNPTAQLLHALYVALG